MKKNVVLNFLFCTFLLSASGTALAVSATGGNMTNVGAYTLHTFTNSGTFSVSASGTVEVLVVAGGGGGGANGGGGGGAGGLIYSNAFSVTGGSNYSVSIGAGGPPQPNYPGSIIVNGGDSVFGPLTALGGGGGSSRDNGPQGATGGSGGGGGGSGNTRYHAGSGTAGQGNNGGNGTSTEPGGGYDAAGGGGGGAGAAGTAGTTDLGGNGGIGLQYVQFAAVGGSPAGWFAGGGAGGVVVHGSNGIGGTNGGGGNAYVAGVANSGGGGGEGAAGGSGIVIVRYVTPVIANLAATNVTPTSACLNGNLISSNGVPTSVFVYWGTNDGAAVAANWGNTNQFADYQPLGALTTNVAGLSSNTIYFYRFCATNSSGTSWASPSSVFITGETSVQATDPIGRMSAADVATFTVYRPAACSNGDLALNYTLGGTATNGTDYTIAPVSGAVVIASGQTNGTITVTPVYKADLQRTVVLTLAPGPYVTGSANSATCTLASVFATSGAMTNIGVYTIHTFTNSGTFSVSASGTVEVLVVAGGGGGGGSLYGSGGGAGGLIYSNAFLISDASNMTVTVGAGGAAGTTGNNGNNSVFGSLTALGGGGGSSSTGNGQSGGSGGGGYSTNGIGGAGTQSVSPCAGYGNNGGNGASGAGGGGGGAGSASINGTGSGGDGRPYSICGTGTVYYAGGGSGAGNTYSSLGGGGKSINSSTAQSGAVNSGGGGGGGWAAAGGSGGSGIVIVRYISPNLPVLNNLVATNVTATSASLNGYLVSTGQAPTTVRVYWGTNDGGTVAANWGHTNNLGVQMPGPLSTNVSLTSGALYFYRYYATNAFGDWWASSSEPVMAGDVTIVATDPVASEVGPDTATFTVTRPTWSTGAAVIVNYAISGTASNGVDYSNLTGNVTIPVGATNATITVLPYNDLQFQEPTETVILALSGGDYQIGAANAATATIANLDGFYVSAQGGDDTTGNGSTNLPWKTITKAFSMLTSTNQAVFLFPGIYSTNTGEVFPLQTAVGVVRVTGYDPAGAWSPTNHIINGAAVGANLFTFSANQQAYLTALTCSNAVRAAVYLDTCSGTLSNCVFCNSTATGDAYPAAVQLVNNSRLMATDCAFRNLRGRGAIGEELAAANNDNNVWLTNCVFESNYSIYGTCYSPQNVAGRFFVTKCIFRANTTPTGKSQDSYRGVGVYVWGSGSLPTSAVSIDRCQFMNNANGAILGCSYLAAAASVKNSLLVGNNCEAMFSGHSWGATLDNCTFVANQGIFDEYHPYLLIILRNCVVVSNLTAVGTSTYVQLKDSLFYQTSLGTYDGANSANVITGVDPNLKADWTLSSGSPAIDAGNNAWMSDPYDLVGNVRRIDGDVNGTTNVDLGCFEFNPAGGNGAQFAVTLPSYKLFAGRTLTLPVSITPAAGGAVTAGVTYPADITGTNRLSYLTGSETNNLALTATSTLSVADGTLVNVSVFETNTSRGVQSLDVGVRLYASKVYLSPSPALQRIFIRAGETNLIQVQLENASLQAPADLTVTPGGVGGSGNHQITWVGGAVITNGGWQTAGYLQIVGGSGDNSITLIVDQGFAFNESSSASMTLQVSSFASPLYVSNSGSDTTGHGTAVDPLKSVAYAESLLRAGEEVRLFPGAYGTNTGEVFPWQPGGVRLIGYEASGSASPTNHIVQGGGQAVNLVKYYQLSAVTNGLLANLTFTNVTQTAVYLDASRLVMTNCSFQNIASGGGVPGGVWLWNNSYVTAQNCEFRNFNSKGAIGIEQGTVANNDNAVWATNCTFVGNYSTFGTLYTGLDMPGQFYLTQCLFQSNNVPNTVIQDSYASSAVYLYAHGALQVDRCRFLDNINGILFGISQIPGVSIRNSLFVNNKCNWDMLYGYSWGGSIVNCTFVRNKGTLSGRQPSSTLYLRNSLVSSNDTAIGGGVAAYMIIQTSLVWQADLGLYVTNSSSGIITNADPLLLPDYSPNLGSPAVNAGNNAWMTDPYDLAGNPRILVGIVDLGAYECVAQSGSVFKLR